MHHLFFGDTKNWHCIKFQLVKKKILPLYLKSSAGLWGSGNYLLFASLFNMPVYSG
jgi:hypothetical protein